MFPDIAKYPLCAKSPPVKTNCLIRITYVRFTWSKIRFTCSPILNTKNPSATTITYTHIMFILNILLLICHNVFELYMKGVPKNLQKHALWYPMTVLTLTNMYIPSLLYEHAHITSPAKNGFYLYPSNCHPYPRKQN